MDQARPLEGWKKQGLSDHLLPIASNRQCGGSQQPQRRQSVSAVSSACERRMGGASLLDPETGAPFKLLPAERDFLQHAFQTDSPASSSPLQRSLPMPMADLKVTAEHLKRDAYPYVRLIRFRHFNATSRAWRSLPPSSATAAVDQVKKKSGRRRRPKPRARFRVQIAAPLKRPIIELPAMHSP
jgi:hypothetical protein